MKNCFLLFVMLVFFIQAFPQIIIDETDMPKEGDTLRVSLTADIPGDYIQTGNDMTWDFSALTKTSQQVNSFVNVMSTPSLYWFTFIPGIVCNLASPGNNLPAFPGLPFSNYFDFLKKSSSQFSDAGYAFQLSGIPIALKYDTPDIFYTFPCTMGSSWSSNSFASISIPGLAYFSSSRSRTSQVDGWGNLTTPFGTFQTIRVKSEVIEKDSIFMDTLGFGIPYTRNITEYKWLGNGQGIPLLQINEEGLLKTAIYRDNINSTGLNEISKKSVRVFPNPTNSYCTIFTEGIHFPVHMILINSLGKVVLEKFLPGFPGNQVSIDLSGFSAGPYLVRLTGEDAVYTGKILVAR
jgi:hypothetical protein